MDDYTRKLEQENFALKTELEQYKRALDILAKPSSAECAFCIAHKNSYCKNDDLSCDDTIRNYALAQAKAGDPHEPDGQN